VITADYQKQYLTRLENVWLRIQTMSNWYQFVFPFNHFSTSHIAKLRNGTRILLRDFKGVDWGVLMDVVGTDDYDIHSIHEPKIIVDAGAHIGVFTVMVATRFPTALVYAIEPEKNNYMQLLKNIKLNNLTNVVPLNVALSTRYGKVKLFIDKSSDSHSLIHIGNKSGSEEVETVPLSHFGHIDALKIDIEGKEQDVLKTAILECQYLSVEIHHAPFRKNLIDTLLINYFLVKRSKNVFVFTRKPFKKIFA